MEKISKLQKFSQIAMISLIAVLAIVLVVKAATTIGTNISTGGTITSTGGLAAFYGNASTSLFTATSTAYIGGDNGLVLSDGSILDGSGTISFGDEIVIFDTNLLYVNATNNRIGIGTTAPTVLLAVGSTTPTTVSGYRDAFFAGNVEVDGSVTIDTDLTVSSDFFVDVSTNAVGIGSTTPMANLSVGTYSATSTIATGRFCMYAENEAGSKYWITINLSASDTRNLFATSTTPCNQ